MDHDLLETLEDRVDPRHTAVLVVDMQNDFCAEGGYINTVLKKDVSESKDVAAAVMKVVEAARKVGAPVIWIKAIYDPRFISGPVIVKQREKGIDAVCCAQGSWGADFFMVSPRADEFVIEKHRYSAFSCTELDNILRDRGIRTLVVTGVATNICVESTFRDGFHRGYYIAIPRDAVGSHNKDAHEATLRGADFLFGDVISADRLGEVWSTAATPRLRRAG